MDTNVYIFWGFIAFTLAEASFAGLWYAPFYRTGLPVYKKQFYLPSVISTKLSIDQLDAEFQSGFTSSIVFREIGEDEYAFREALLQIRFLSYTPLMHGHILIDPRRGIVTVVGRLYWTVFSLAFFVLWPADWVLEIIPFLVVLLFALYSVQVHRFNKVGVLVKKLLALTQD